MQGTSTTTHGLLQGLENFLFGMANNWMISQTCSHTLREEYLYNLAINPVTTEYSLCENATVVAGNKKKFQIYHDKNGKTFPKSSWVLFTQTGIGIVMVSSKGIYFITEQNEIIKAPAELDVIDNVDTYSFEDYLILNFNMPCNCVMIFTLQK